MIAHRLRLLDGTMTTKDVEEDVDGRRVKSPGLVMQVHGPGDGLMPHLDKCWSVHITDIACVVECRRRQK